MKTIAALFLASLLAVMAYGIFWLACLNYTTSQLRGAVQEGLGASLAYGTAQWVPDPTRVTMDLPNATLAIGRGPVREILANSLRLSSGFLMRDRWTLELPKHVEVRLANGKVMILETEQGKVSWLEESRSLTLRAKSVRLLDLTGMELVQIGDVMMERKAAQSAVKVNLASRPNFAGGQGVLSGQLVLPPNAFASVVDKLGEGRVPGLAETMHTIARSLLDSAAAGDAANAALTFENVSFKAGAMSGAVYGTLQVLRDGRTTGTLAVTADNLAHVMDWVNRSGIIQPRHVNDQAGVKRFQRGMYDTKATVSIETMQDTLLLNGQPVGPLPQLMNVVGRLWPRG